MDQSPSGGEPPAGDRTRAIAVPGVLLTDEEVHRRRARTIAATANARLAGLSISPETLEIMDAYDRGEIGADEMMSRIRDRHVARRAAAPPPTDP